MLRGADIARLWPPNTPRLLKSLRTKDRPSNLPRSVFVLRLASTRNYVNPSKNWFFSSVNLSPLSFPQVDATVESSLGEKFGIRGYPTLKFFKNGNPSEYGGGRKADDIVGWLNKKTGPAAKALNSEEDLKAFIEGSEVAVVGFFSDPTADPMSIYLRAAGEIEGVPFGEYDI